MLHRPHGLLQPDGPGDCSSAAPCTLVEEFMLLANMAVAHQIYRSFPTRALLRRHPPPQSKMLHDLMAFCNQMGLEIDCSSAGTLHKSLNETFGNDQYSDARKEVLTNMFSRPMQMAVYFCTGVLKDENLFRHYALNVPLYTHFTARKDGRLCSVPATPWKQGGVRGQVSSPDFFQPEGVSFSRAGSCPTDGGGRDTEASRALQRPEDGFQAGAGTERRSLLCRFCQGGGFKAIRDPGGRDRHRECGPLESEAMVMGVLSEAFDVLVLRFGVQKRIYCNALPLVGFQFQKVGKKPQLSLVWEPQSPEQDATRQVISIFALVDVVLRADNGTTSTAVLKRPGGEE
ncbi:hypothetical protein E2320_001418 [Naja naja]|nr:hypothetical protein E2320_001418 [Naja naja]